MTTIAQRVNLVQHLYGSGQADDALALCERLLADHPEDPRALAAKGVILASMRRTGEAVDLLRRSLAVLPHQPDVEGNLGSLLALGGDTAGAERHLRAAIAMDPKGGEQRYGLALVYLQQGRVREASAAVDDLLAVDPAHAQGRWARAQLLLLLGRFAEGWEAYECRWSTPGLGAARFPSPMPEWDGGPLEGRTVFLYAEQGLGDAIQFVRYAPLVAGRGARVFLGVPQPLSSVLATVTGVAGVVVPGQPVPAHDHHLALMSLPRVFATSLDTIPRQIPYLAADPARIEAMRPMIAGAGVKAGLVWQGNPAHRQDGQRSFPGLLSAIGSIPGVSIHSLQVGAGRSAPLTAGVIDLAPRLNDFGDTAAALELLDLIVTVDTSVAHLAGALGRPVWLLLPRVPDWRWLLDRDDSPWYPTMRLYRQAVPGDWSGVVERVVRDLAALGSVYLAS